jgi:hypothetical protein
MPCAPILSARPGINGDAIWELPLPRDLRDRT